MKIRSNNGFYNYDSIIDQPNRTEVLKRVSFFFALFLFYLASNAQTVSWMGGTGCVNQPQTFYFNANCNNVNWQIRGVSDNYTINEQTNQRLIITWHSVVDAVGVNASYSSCSGISNGTAYSQNINITNYCRPSKKGVVFRVIRKVHFKKERLIAVPSSYYN